MSELSYFQKRLLSVVTDAPQLAYDLAQAAEVNNRSAASALSGLYRRNLVAREWSARDRAYRYAAVERVA
jgi:hypothetical protein